MDQAGLFARLKQIALDSYDRFVGLILDQSSIDGCITMAPGGGECAGPFAVDRRKQGMKRSLMVEGYGIPLGRVLPDANRHDSPLLAPTLDKLDDLGPLPEDISVHLDSGYDSGKTHDGLAGRSLQEQISHKGEKAPIQASDAGRSSAPTPDTTRSTGPNAATNAARSSSTPTSTSPTRS